MTTNLRRGLLMVACAAFGVSVVRADHIVIEMQGQRIEIEGKASKPQNRMVEIRHDVLDPRKKDEVLWLPHKKTDEMIYVSEIWDSPTAKEHWNGSKDVLGTKDAARIMELGVWALRKGMVKEFGDCLTAALAVDANHAEAKRMKAFYDKIMLPLPSNPQDEAYIRGHVGKDRKLKETAHYIIAYDTTEPQLMKRVDLLERVYGSFLCFFALKGRELELPTFRLPVVLFAQHKDYVAWGEKDNPGVRSAAGYWSRVTNLAVFYAQETDERFQEKNEMRDKLRTLVAELNRLKSGGRGDIVRLQKTVELLLRVDVESENIEVVTHEGTHQMAGNTGLLPRDVAAPTWVHEGLAAYFEAPKDASWSGIGSVNQMRLGYYKGLAERQPYVVEVEFVATNRIFSRAQGTGSQFLAYAPSWALTHFMMEKKFDLFMKYYDSIASMPPDMRLPESMIWKAFLENVGKDPKAIQSEWLLYMNGLKTDFELVKEKAKKT